MTKTVNFTLYSGARRMTDWSTWFRNDVRDLSDLCREFTDGDYSIDIIRHAEERQRAFRAGVFTTPAILVELPCGRLQNLGGLPETKEFLQKRQLEQVSPALDLR